MGTLPASGTAISMGRTGKAYTNVPAGSQSVSFGASATMQLNAQIGRGATTNTPFSGTFGGLTTPFDY
jgi:hypothetical protein